jgi:DNA-binding NarL/FixJ family response regulator
VRILVADDHAVVRKGVCTILSSRADLECEEAENGREAIEKAIALGPDMVVLDITMPVLSGLDAAREIKNFLPQVPILILSMHTGEHVIKQLKSLGVQGFVTKGQAATTLLQAVDALLNGQTFFASSTAYAQPETI